MDERTERVLRAKVKHELRRRIRAVRNTLPKDARAERSRKMSERLLALPEIQNAKTIASFVAIHREVVPPTLALLEQGKTIALPLVDLEAQEVRLHAFDGGELERGAYGIPEPQGTPTIDHATIDAIFVPCLAIDPRGHRVGYGKGFYDRLLPTLKRAFKCAIAFDFQLVPEVPNLPEDVAVDAIVTDTRVLYAET